MKGMRVQSIIRELRGEKIDIIPYSEDTVAFAQKSLSPAKVTRVQIIDPETRHLEVIVEDTQLSLAIGKKGQNVRLASKLIGWNVDIKSEEEKRQELEAQMAALTAPGTPLVELVGMGPKTVEKIEAAGISSIERLADMTPEQLMEIPGIGEKMVEKIQQAVAAYFQSLENQAAGEGGEAVEAAEGQELSAEAAEGTEVSEENAELAASSAEESAPDTAESEPPAAVASGESENQNESSPTDAEAAAEAKSAGEGENR
jgi:N utilization substance protein A